jgi:hypothetical protein
MTGIGLTSGHGLYFFSETEHVALLRSIGFDVRVERLDNWLPYPHVLFECRT